MTEQEAREYYRRFIRPGDTLLHGLTGLECKPGDLVLSCYYGATPQVNTSWERALHLVVADKREKGLTPEAMSTSWNNLRFTVTRPTQENEFGWVSP